MRHKGGPATTTQARKGHQKGGRKAHKRTACPLQDQVGKVTSLRPQALCRLPAALGIKSSILLLGSPPHLCPEATKPGLAPSSRSLSPTVYQERASLVTHLKTAPHMCLSSHWCGESPGQDSGLLLSNSLARSSTVSVIWSARAQRVLEWMKKNLTNRERKKETEGRKERERKKERGKKG